MTILNYDNLTYAQWSQQVDIIVCGQVGLGIDDCADWPQRQCFDTECSPMEAASCWGTHQDNLPPDVLDYFQEHAELGA